MVYMCPFLEQSDPQCAGCLSLHRLDDALRFCSDNYEQCPVYQKKFLDDARNSRNYRQEREFLRAAG